jgi:hypothetical protein
VTGPSTSQAQVRVTWTGRADVSDASDAFFTINRPPTAAAGPDQTVELGSPATLDGRASSDPDGDPLHYEWKDTDGAVVGAAPTVTLDLAFGVHTFTLTVSDDFGGSASDAVVVTVEHTTTLGLTVSGLEGGHGTVHVSSPVADCTNAGASDATCTYTYTTEPTVTLTAEPASDSIFLGWQDACAGSGSCVVALSESKTVTARFRITNRPPLARAGGPYSGVRGVAVAFDGTASSDPDGDALTYAWDFGDGASGTGPTPSHAYATLGTFTATLVVSDGKRLSAASTATVSIVNRPPVANAGADQIVELGRSFTLDGGASSDPDGDPLGYEWRDAAGGLVGTTATVVLTRPRGAYPFTLTVGDGKGGTGTSSTSVQVVDTTPPAVSVSAPRDVVLTAGLPLVVEWTASDLGGLAGFDVYYSADGGATFTPVGDCAGLAADVRSCTWTQPGPAASPALLRVAARDITGNVGIGETSFTLAGPVITITAPAPGAAWGLGSQQTIQWTHNLGPGSSVRVEVSHDAGAGWMLLAEVPNATATTGSFDWVVGESLTATARVRVTWTANPEVMGESGDFTIAPPSVVVTSPNGGTWLVGSTRTITWAHNLGTHALVRIEITRDNGASWSVIGASQPNSGPTTGAFNWTVTLPRTSQARIRVTWTANDAVTDQSDSAFVIR